MNALAHAQRTRLERPDAKPRVCLPETPASLIRANLSAEDQARFELGYNMARAALQARA